MKPLTVADIVAELDRRTRELRASSGPGAGGRRDELRVLRDWILRGGATASDARGDMGMGVSGNTVAS